MQMYAWKLTADGTVWRRTAGWESVDVDGCQGKEGRGGGVEYVYRMGSRATLEVISSSRHDRHAEFKRCVTEDSDDGGDAAGVQRTGPAAPPPGKPCAARRCVCLRQARFVN
jgi:hypothetical protein